MATSFNGPLKVYQRVNPTNDGTGNGLVSNSGAVASFQPATIPGTGAAAANNIAYIPAGSYLQNVRLIVTTGANTVAGGALNVVFTPDGGSAITVGSLTVPAVGATSAGYVDVVWTQAAAGTIANVGSIAGYLSLASTTIPLLATYNTQTEYIIRNTDGTITNTGANLSNS